MKLVLLGTGGYFPTARRQTACLMLPEIGVVLDAGTGMYRLGKHLQTDRLDIFLTHAHLDHIAGLTYLLNLVPDDVCPHDRPWRSSKVGGRARAPVCRRQSFPCRRRSSSNRSAATFRLHVRRHAHAIFPCNTPAARSASASIGPIARWPMSPIRRPPRAPHTSNIFAASISWCTNPTFPADRRQFAGDHRAQLVAAVAALAAEAQVGRLVVVHIDPLCESDSAFDLDSARSTFQNIEVARDEMELDF